MNNVLSKEEFISSLKNEILNQFSTANVTIRKKYGFTFIRISNVDLNMFKELLGLKKSLNVKITNSNFNKMIVYI